MKNNDLARRKLGAPFGNRNALKTGAHTAEVRAWKKRVAAWRRRVRVALAEAESCTTR
jgi:hypothetical protein